MSGELTAHQKDLLLMALKHYLPCEVRRQIMHEIPTAYNAWMGREIMVTVQANKVGEIDS